MRSNRPTKKSRLVTYAGSAALATSMLGDTEAIAYANTAHKTALSAHACSDEFSQPPTKAATQKKAMNGPLHQRNFKAG